ncbi:TPA: hypothetical protein R1604_000009 [Campylobacter jejuni]
MKKINIVCLGSCDMYPIYGFVDGLRNNHTRVISYGESYNGAHSMIYHLKRNENQNYIKNADLIIVGWITNGCFKELIPIYKILYNRLYNLKKKILICIWPEADFNDELEMFHYKQINHYGFNMLDIRKYCKEKEIFKFYTSYYDWQHPFYSFMSGISKRIINEIDKMQYPKQVNGIDDIDIIVISFSEFVDKNMIEKTRTFTHYENIYKLKNNKEVKIPSVYKDYILVGIHMINKITHTNFILKNHNKQFLVSCMSGNYVVPINYNNFIIDEETYIKCSTDDPIKKMHPIHPSVDKNVDLGLIAMLFIKDSKYLQDDQVGYIECELLSKYDFSYILDFLIEGKNFIEDYNKRQDLLQLVPLQNQIKEKDNIISTLNQEKITLQNELNSLPIKKQNLKIKNLEQALKNKELQSFVLKKELGNKFVKNININYIDKNSAKSRIHNHLSYKLGQALIENSKSILGYIRMLYVLSYIKDKHKFEQKAYEEKIKDNPNLALPPLETYPDYNEALKEKECFTYKLGEALMQANKNWYGGGYIKFYFKDVPRLKREFGKR